MYFFEENLPLAILRAMHQVTLRAQRGVIDSPAVLVADLDISDCLDLSSSQWHTHLMTIADKLRRSGALRRQHAPVLSTHAGKSVEIGDYAMAPHTFLEHDVDKQVIDALVKDLFDGGRNVSSVRASFADGSQPYSNSHFFSDTHTQIAVLTPDTVVSPIRILHPLNLSAQKT